MVMDLQLVWVLVLVMSVAPSVQVVGSAAVTIVLALDFVILPELATHLAVEVCSQLLHQEQSWNSSKSLILPTLLVVLLHQHSWSQEAVMHHMELWQHVSSL